MQRILMLATFTGLSIFLTGNYQLLAQNPNNQVDYDNDRPANCPMLNAQNSSGANRPMGNRRNWDTMPGRQGRTMFDPNTVTTISGEILSVDQITNNPRNNQNTNQNTNPNQPRNHQGIHLTLKSADQTIDIHVGPAWYLEQEKMVFTAGDQVRIKGFPMNKNNQSFFVAQEITKGSQVLVLRDEDGLPMWRGQGQRAGQGMRRQPTEY